jgi:hypothetical protein
VIVVFSSSSPIASVALLDDEGALVASGEEEARNQASGALLFTLDRLLTESGLSLGQSRLFVADLGPGSFTGVKVAVTSAKVMAFAQGIACAGVTAFGLVNADATVALPSRKGEFFVRVPGQPPVIASEVPMGAFGYGAAFEDQCYPLAKNAAGRTFEAVRPEQLVPLYIAEPSISKPRDPKILGGPRA